MIKTWHIEHLERPYAWERFGLIACEQGTRLVMIDVTMVIVDSYVNDKTVSFTAVREDSINEWLDWRIGTDLPKGKSLQWELRA